MHAGRQDDVAAVALDVDAGGKCALAAWHAPAGVLYEDVPPAAAGQGLGRFGQ